MDGLRISTGAIASAGTSMDVTANNLANVSTPGFRADSVNFQTGSGGRGVAVGSVAESTLPGPVVFTGRPLDLALEGDAFFAVRDGNGRLAFTRDGSFTVDGQGRIVNQNGYLLDPEITVPNDATSVAVASDGAVTAARRDGTTTDLGRVQPVRFTNPQGLLQIGQNLAVPTPNSGAGRRVNADIMPASLTMSNTDIATEMVNLMQDQRFTEANVKMAKAEDELLGTILDMKR